MSKRPVERVTCPVCGQKVGSYTPAGGDGSAQRVYRHKRISPNGYGMDWCPGRYDLVT